MIIGAAAAFWWVNNQRKNKNRRTAPSKSTGRTVEPRKEPKTKKTRKDGSEQDVKHGKKKPTQSAQVEEKAYTSAVDVNEKKNDEIDNREFARQLSSVKSGTIIAPKSQGSSRPKSVKQTRAQEKPPVENSSDNATAPSSTTGGDADDDESPINSPDLGATSMTPIANGDVSDMLEQPAAGAQVLKIVPSTNPTPAKKAKEAKAQKPAETKRQRQNKQRAEAQKLAREEEEKARRVLEERQRRLARESNGIAAKDGSAFMAASKAPAESAWTAPVSAVKGAKPATSKVELLDTYEPLKTNGTTSKSGETVFSPSEVAGSQLAKEYGGLSEEEQIRIIQEESEEWKTVQSKEKKKRNTVKDTAGSQDDKKTSANETKDYGVPPVIAPTGPGQAWAVNTVHVQPDKKVVEREIEVQDSEWEVA